MFVHVFQLLCRWCMQGNCIYPVLIGSMYCVHCIVRENFAIPIIRSYILINSDGMIYVYIYKACTSNAARIMQLLYTRGLAIRDTACCARHNCHY